MPHPASRDGAIAGINIATLFHVPVVPPGITPGPSQDATYDEVHLECGVPPPNHDSLCARNSTCCNTAEDTVALLRLFDTELTTANCQGLSEGKQHCEIYANNFCLLKISQLLIGFTCNTTKTICRAATNILAKIRNSRDLTTCQKRPKSDLNYA